MGYEATFLNRHPYAEDLILLIEVAEVTLSRDCNLKSASMRRLVLLISGEKVGEILVADVITVE